MHLLKFFLCFFKEHQKCVSHVDGLQKTVIAFMLFFSSRVYLTHTRKICYNNANNNTHISIFCDRHVCHSSLTSFGTLLQVYAYTRYNFYIEYAIMQEKEKTQREKEREEGCTYFLEYFGTLEVKFLHRQDTWNKLFVTNMYDL